VQGNGADYPAIWDSKIDIPMIKYPCNEQNTSKNLNWVGEYGRQEKMQMVQLKK
jgi:hypothetical protein